MVQNPLHGVESSRTVVVLPPMYSVGNPLHGVESTARFNPSNLLIPNKNPLHGVERHRTAGRTPRSRTHESITWSWKFSLYSLLMKIYRIHYMELKVWWSSIVLSWCWVSPWIHYMELKVCTRVMSSFWVEGLGIHYMELKGFTSDFTHRFYPPLESITWSWKWFAYINVPTLSTLYTWNPLHGVERE